LSPIPLYRIECQLDPSKTTSLYSF
jgi:hypothetical protein